MVRTEGQADQGMRSRNKRCVFRRFCRDTQGSSALEFAIVAVPLFLLILATLQLSFVYFPNYVLETAASKAARLVRTGQAQALTAEQLKTEVCKDLIVPLSCSNLELDIRFS